MMRILLLLCLMCVFYVPGAGANTEACDSDEITLRWNAEPAVVDILLKTIDTYRALDTFQATGTIQNQSKEYQSSSTFSMVLAKPDLYKIEWYQTSFHGEAMTGAIWHDGSAHYYKGVYDKKPEKNESMMMNMSSAQGVSGGITIPIPSLFFDWGDCHIFGGYANVVRFEDKTINDRKVYVLKGDSPISSHDEIWIDQETYMIHKFWTADDGGGSNRAEVDAIIQETIQKEIDELTLSEEYLVDTWPEDSDVFTPEVMEQAKAGMAELKKSYEEMTQREPNGFSQKVYENIQTNLPLKKNNFRFKK